MSITFNHPSNTMTSSGSLNITVSGGSITTPLPIRLNATSVVMPVRALPTGEAGAMVFDSSTLTLKYHDGFSWIELLSKSAITSELATQVANIETELSTKIDSVTYTSSLVPSASVSGTTLNIVFPTSTTTPTGSSGLYTSLKPGAIMQYSLTSGQSVSSIREQMSGVTGGQSGRSGTSTSPYVTNDGWCLADGNYWTWVGTSGTVTKQVPNLNQAIYLKSISASGVTKTDSIIAATGSITGTALTVAQLPAHSFTFSGTTSTNGAHFHSEGSESVYTSAASHTVRALGTSSTLTSSASTSTNGDHSHTFSGTTNTVGSGTTHTHTLSNVDLDHANVAILYNIAEQSFAINKNQADGLYVKIAGDTMTGQLQVANALTLAGSGSNLVMYFRNTSGGERAVIYHSSSNNTLRFRTNGGTEASLNTAGTFSANGFFASGNVGTSTLNVSGSSQLATLTVYSGLNVTVNQAVVNGKHIVRSINGINADSAGNVTTLQASMSNTGWWRDISSGLVLQWGITTIPISNDRRGSQQVTFPTSFSTVYSVTATANTDQWESGGYLAVVTAANISTTGFTAIVDSNTGRDLKVAQRISWQAIGVK